MDEWEGEVIDLPALLDAPISSQLTQGDAALIIRLRNAVMELAREREQYREHMAKHFPARGSTLGDMTKMEEIVDDAAARFDERPLHRASIEAQCELASSKVKLDLSDPETRAVWEIAQAAKREVASWPAWKTGAVALGETVEDLRLALQERDSALKEAERMRGVFKAAVEWFKAPHVDNANHAAGDCDECPARVAKAFLRVKLAEACGAEPDRFDLRVISTATKEPK